MVRLFWHRVSLLFRARPKQEQICGLSYISVCLISAFARFLSIGLVFNFLRRCFDEEWLWRGVKITQAPEWEHKEHYAWGNICSTHLFTTPLLTPHHNLHTKWEKGAVTVWGLVRFFVGHDNQVKHTPRGWTDFRALRRYQANTLSVFRALGRRGEGANLPVICLRPTGISEWLHA